MTETAACCSSVLMTNPAAAVWMIETALNILIYSARFGVWISMQRCRWDYARLTALVTVAAAVATRGGVDVGGGGGGGVGAVVVVVVVVVVPWWWWWNGCVGSCVHTISSSFLSFSSVTSWRQIRISWLADANCRSRRAISIVLRLN